MSEDLLAGYQKVSSFALWDGEYAILRFVGGVDDKFTKTDSKGTDHTYLGCNVYLYKHSNENYNHMEGTECILRCGNDSTLAKWIADGGLKAKEFDIVYRIDMRKSLGYGLRIEGREDTYGA